MKDDSENRLQDVHSSAIAALVEMVAPLLDDDADEDAREEAREAVHMDPLSVEVRSGWHVPGDKPEIDEFRILLTTGGPAVQIIGEVDSWGQPVNPRLQVQDWFLPWTEFPTSGDEDEALQAYCNEFYFGEG